MKELTIEEMEAIEDYAGVAFETMADPTVPKSKMLKAIVWVVKRRDNPDFTIDDAGKIAASEAGEIIEAVFESLEDPKQ